MSGPANLHGTAIALRGVGILIRGAARSGKSALALSALRRAEALRWPCGLVADDQVMVERRAGDLVAFAPKSIAGLIEVSGVGIVSEREAGPTVLRLVADLCRPEAIERMPEEEVETIAGIALRRVRLPERQAAFAADVLHSLVPFLCAGVSPCSPDAQIRLGERPSGLSGTDP